MKDAIQAVLVDPIDDSREALRRLLGGVTTIGIAEVCTSYQGAIRRVAELSPGLVVVNIDADPG
jgi:hypothetical protein